MGSGFKASNNLQTSVANQEIIPSAHKNRTIGYGFYKLSFYNDQDCHIIINDNGDPLFIRAEQGLNSDRPDALIKSFKILEDGITFNWFGAY